MVGARLLRLSLSVLILLGSIQASASDYRFNLYFGFGPFSLPTGNAHLYDTETVFEGRDAIRTAIELNTSQTVNRVFVLKDTIESYNTPQGESLFFRKIVNEGNRHNLETARFSKENEKFVADLTTWNMVTGARTSQATETRDTRIFDLMSMISFAQKINTKGIKPGYTKTLPMVNGNMVVQQYLVYTGDKKIKADNGKTYDCMIISIRDRKEGKERETVKAYVTNDSRHAPIQLEIILGGGTKIKALLK